MAGRNARSVVVGSLGPDPQPAGIFGRGLPITGCLSGDIATYHKAMRSRPMARG